MTWTPGYVRVGIRAVYRGRLGFKTGVCVGAYHSVVLYGVQGSTMKFLL